MPFLFSANLPYAVSVSAYYLQKMSDLSWINSTILSTKLAQISSIRHYRASIMMSNTIFYRKKIDFKMTDLNDINFNELASTFFCNEFTINSTINSIKKYNSDELLNKYYNSFTFTQNYIFEMLKLPKDKIPFFEIIYKDTLIKNFICTQCGEIYMENLKNISECNFCGAGLNHINSFKDIL